MSGADVVRAVLAAYTAQDRDAMERLLADDLRFTSPQDDAIDRAAYFERCFPTAERMASQQVVHVAEVEGSDDVFLLYEYVLRAGGRFRNAEVLTVRDGRVHEIQVFFGGNR